MSKRGASGNVILLVEHHRSLASLISSVLGKEGFTVVTAGSRKEALEISKEVAPIQLLIKDVSTPSGGGPDLASEICAAHPEMKILFLSSAGEQELKGRGLGEKAHVLPKPLAITDLVTKVSELLMS